MDDPDSCSLVVRAGAGTAGGALEAPNVIQTALIVLCCMGDCPGIPMNVGCFFFFGVGGGVSQHPSWTPFFLLLHPNIFSPNFFIALPLHLLIFYPSFFLFVHLVCLLRCLSLLLKVVGSDRSELCSHFLHHWGEEASCIDSAPSTCSLSLFVSVSGCLLFLFSQPLSAVFSVPLFLVFPTSLDFWKYLWFTLGGKHWLYSPVAGCNCIMWHLYIIMQSFFLSG